MNKKPSSYAPIGLALSGLAFLAIVGVMVVKAFDAMSLYTPPDEALLERILYIGIAVFVAGFAVYAILDPDRVRKFLSGRQVRYGSNSFIMFAAFVGILVVINVLATQFPKRWDVTEDKQHTLAPETMEALATLPEPVQATAFFSTRLRTETTRQLLEDFKVNSAGKFNYQFMDPDANPVLVNELGITGDGKILLQMGENQEIVTLASERELTSGLIRLLNPEQPVLYFLTGNGEHDTENAGDTAYTRIKQVLQSKNYIVQTLNLQAQADVPVDASALVIGGPQIPLSEEMVDTLKGYLENGGKLLVMLDPVPLTKYGDKADPLGEYLSADWGITPENDLVVDRNSPSSPLFAVGAQYNMHAITEKMQGVAAIFPFARSLTLNTDVSGISTSPLVLTLPSSWGETDFNSIEQQSEAYDEGADRPGPMTLGAVAENFSTGARLVVFGNSSFPQDSNFDFSGNGDLMINSIDWLVEKEDLIGITTHEATVRTLDPIGSIQIIMLVISTVCLIPLVISVAGFYAWIKRRRRG